MGVPWDGRTAYERWVEDDLGVDLHRGYSGSSLKAVAVKPWAERGISAAFYDVIGAESLAGMYVGEIAPGQSSQPARQLCDEVIFVMAGRGSTSVDTPKGQVSFEWGPRSLFAIPLNHRYQLHNSSGREPARFVSVNTIPIVYNLFRDAKFVFGCDWHFDRINAEASLSDSVLYRPDEKHERTAVNLHETTFGVVVPPNMWWHGHFGTSPSSMQLAIKLRSRKFPLNHLFDKTHKLVSEGGTVLRYKDLEEGLRNRVWQTYVEECRRRGHEVKDPNQA